MSRIDEELKRIRAKLNDRYEDEEQDLEDEIENGLDEGFDDFDDDFDDDYDDDYSDTAAQNPGEEVTESSGQVNDSAGYEDDAEDYESDAEGYDESDAEDYADAEDYENEYASSNGSGSEGYGESEYELVDETGYESEAEYDDEYEDEYEGGADSVSGDAGNGRRGNIGRDNNSRDNRNDPRNELERFAEEPEEYTDYYGIEQVKKRPVRKIVPKEQEKTRSLRMKRYKEQSLARYSNIYMIAGVFIGIAIFFFLVSPELKDNYNQKLREVETKYNKTLSTKNSEIDNLKQEVDGLTAKNEEYANTQAAMQTNIDNLSNEVEMLKQNVENNGMMVATTTDAYVATNTDAIPAGVAVPNAAAERNNANVIGISRTAIEEMIKHE
ncbi:MAG: hypothetical protein K5865_08640 [Eubacterium sp.]|nr:hypothetical protein [Eubacterium sp.]